MNRLEIIKTSVSTVLSALPKIENWQPYALIVGNYAIGLMGWISANNREQANLKRETLPSEAKPKKCNCQENNKFKMNMYKETINALERHRSEDCKNAEVFYLSLGITGMIEKVSNPEQLACLKGIEADINHLFELYYSDDNEKYKTGVNTCLERYKGLISP